MSEAADGKLLDLVERARHASPGNRIEFRDPIAALRWMRTYPARLRRLSRRAYDELTELLGGTDRRAEGR